MAKKTKKKKKGSKKKKKTSKKRKQDIRTTIKKLKKMAKKGRKGNKRTSGNPGVAKKGGRRAKVMSKAEKFMKGFLGGAGSAQLAGDGVSLVTDNGTVQVAAKIGAGAAGGYWVGKKSVEGAVGGVIAELFDLGLNLAKGGGGLTTSRFRL